jgi:hypothetical protein
MNKVFECILGAAGIVLIISITAWAAFVATGG